MKNRRRFILITSALALGVAALLASTFLVAYTDRSYICENTGSRKGCREWFFGVKTNEWYRKSKLEVFYETNHPRKLSHRWTSYAGDGHSLVPFLLVRGHGRPGPILWLTPIMLDNYVMELSDEKKLELYELFSSADERKIQDVVETICGSYKTP